MLSHSEFTVLRVLYEKRGKHLTQLNIAEILGVSVGKVNAVCKKLAAASLITISRKNGSDITDTGIDALMPYRAKNAIIMAAGMSTRFAPLSYEMPKGLLLVKGEILIERQIRQLKEAGIADIIVVVGYMKEKMFYLAEKFGVKIVVNEDYYIYNNTSSLMCVIDEIDNSYICSCDDYFTENVFSLYVYRSYYAAQYTPEKTDEYCLGCDRHGLIKSISFGGEDAWYMIGHAYFDHSFCRTFTDILRREYDDPLTKTQLWENLYARFIDMLPLYIKQYDAGIIEEFDSLDELRHFDSKYITNVDSDIFNNIKSVLECSDEDIGSIKVISAGLTNSSFCFSCKGQKYVYRHPGAGTDMYINRKGETFAMKYAKELSLDDTFIYMDEKKGWKISRFIENVRDLDYHNEKEVLTALTMIKKLHDAKIHSPYDNDIRLSIEKFADSVRAYGRDNFEDFTEMYDDINTVFTYTEKDGCDKCLCHCDFYNPNLLVDENGKIYLIDWEYAGNADPANDIGTFIACSDYTYEEAAAVIKLYLGSFGGQKELRHCIAYVAVASYYWFVWALYQESVGKTTGSYLYLWYRYTKLYSKKALALYQSDHPAD